MNDFLGYIIPVIAVIVSYICGALQNRTSYDKRQLQTRYNKFYVPFIKHLYTTNMWNSEYSIYDYATRQKFLNMALDNIQHLGKTSQELFPEYYNAVAFLQTTSEDNPSLNDIKTRCNIVFRKFTKAVIEESKPLSRKLHLPELAHTYEIRAVQSANRE